QEMPFLVFTHVASKSPFLSVPRTLRRVPLPDGSQTYNNLNQFRQQIYLNRLLRAAHALAYQPSFPANNEEAEADIQDILDYILKWTGWYAPEKYVNSFPSKLSQGHEFTVHREMGNFFKVIWGFEQGVIAEFGLSF